MGFLDFLRKRPTEDRQDVPGRMPAGEQPARDERERFDLADARVDAEVADEPAAPLGEPEGGEPDRPPRVQ